jgi:hypothetical protein
MSDLTAEFVRCLNVMSSCRASWDAYDRSSADKAAGDRAEAQALNRVRQIWHADSAMQDDLRAAFVAARPLATMAEIERPSQ